jgi:hypothetical protein
MNVVEKLLERPFRTAGILIGTGSFAVFSFLQVESRGEQNQRYHDRVVAELGTVGVAECTDQESTDFPCIASISLSSANTQVRTGPEENQTITIYCDTFDPRPGELQERRGCFLPDEESNYSPYAIRITSKQQLIDASARQG